MRNVYPKLIARLTPYQLHQLSLVLVALPERNRTIFSLLCAGHTQTQIAKTFNISQARISKLQAQTLAAIGEFLK